MKDSCEEKEGKYHGMGKERREGAEGKVCRRSMLVQFILARRPPSNSFKHDV